jgi:hypothetical protein
MRYAERLAEVGSQIVNPRDMSDLFVAADITDA